MQGEEDLRGIKPAGAPFGPPGRPKGGGGRPPIFERKNVSYLVSRRNIKVFWGLRFGWWLISRRGTPSFGDLPGKPNGGGGKGWPPMGPPPPPP